jgi:hypothetical protein
MHVFAFILCMYVLLLNLFIFFLLSFIHTYIPRSIPEEAAETLSDIPPRPKWLWEILQTWQLVSPSPSDRDHLTCKYYKSVSPLTPSIAEKERRGAISVSDKPSFLSLFLSKFVNIGSAYRHRTHETTWARRNNIKIQQTMSDGA